MLSTNLKHLETEKNVTDSITGNKYVMICCGRMGPMCIPVYDIMETLQTRFPHVVFMDMDFDIPAARCIRRLPECRGFMGLPFTVYFVDGKAVRATSSIQSEEQVVAIINEFFPAPLKG